MLKKIMLLSFIIAIGINTNTASAFGVFDNFNDITNDILRNTSQFLDDLPSLILKASDNRYMPDKDAPGYFTTINNWPYPDDYAWPYPNLPGFRYDLVSNPWPSAYCTDYITFTNFDGNTYSYCRAELGIPRVADTSGLSLGEIADKLADPHAQFLIKAWLQNDLNAAAILNDNRLEMKGGSILLKEKYVNVGKDDTLGKTYLPAAKNTQEFFLYGILKVMGCGVSVVDNPDFDIRMGLFRSSLVDLNWDKSSKELVLSLRLLGWAGVKMDSAIFRAGCDWGVMSSHVNFNSFTRLVVPLDLQLNVGYKLGYEYIPNSSLGTDLIRVTGDAFVDGGNVSGRSNIVEAKIRVEDISDIEDLLDVDDMAADVAGKLEAQIRDALKTDKLNELIDEYIARQDQELSQYDFESVYDLPSADNLEAVKLVVRKLNYANQYGACLEGFVKEHIAELTYADIAGESSLWESLKQQAEQHAVSCLMVPVISNLLLN
jgi:hypothetical protein